MWTSGDGPFGGFDANVEKNLNVEQQFRSRRKSAARTGSAATYPATQAAAQGMGETKTKEAKGGTGLNILESRGVQNFNISIDKLVEMIKVETTQIKEGAGEIKEIVAQALIEAVNDFQLMATK